VRIARAVLVALAAGSLIATAGLTKERRQRLSPTDVKSLPAVGAGAGTSGLKAITTRLLLGNPERPGSYTIAIQVPPNTHIASHSHRDDRTAVVARGLWHFGYGARADDAATRPLPAGSYYTEPAGDPHFAWTGPEGATVYISGTGPSDTRYTARTAR
jgi:uncharacterized RmlC-like cupin family protein